MKIFSPCLLFLLAFAVPCVGIQIPTTAVPNGVVSDSYLGVVQVSGGCAPYTWSVDSGSLPPGVTTKTSEGTSALALYGTPTKAATYTFGILAKSCGGQTAKASFTVAVQSTPYHVVDLNWAASKSKDVVGYNIYRGADGWYWSKINSNLNAATTYSDSTVANKTVYYYATTAVDIEGHESKKSNVVKSTIP